MIKFLIDRPIAVLMTYLAILVLGISASGLLPVSLIPNIDIPEITVQLQRPGESARQIEESIVKNMRYHLMQVPHLEKFKSESMDGRAIFHLRFKYGTDINYAFIDVNEKTDEALRYLPSDVERPAIVKASASDLPAFYINVWVDDNNPQKFLEMSELTRTVLIKRLEQIQEISMVDITGSVEPELFIEPDENLLASLGITHQDIIYALEQNNLSTGSIEVADGQYRFNIRFINRLRTVDNVKQISLKVGSRMMKLEELAKIEMRPRKEDGAFMRNGKPAISMAVIKNSTAKMDDLKKETEKLINHFRRSHSGINFEIVRDQTAILEYSINNLKENLIFGGLLAFFILFFFLQDARSPWLIGFSIPISLVISLLFFHIINLSINIISLSGLILGIGMMIDNSIIVIDNIIYYRKEGKSLYEACIAGTNEVITPLLSSVLTTCAVFIPLIFLSGISGALFYDQAMAVAIGLGVSLLVAITLLPVLFNLFHKKSSQNNDLGSGRVTKWLQKVNLFKIEEAYERSFEKLFKRRKLALFLFLGLFIPAAILFFVLEKRQFPEFTHDDVFVEIDWNLGIHLTENKERVQLIDNEVESLFEMNNSYIGVQNFMVQQDLDQTFSEAKLYYKCENSTKIDELKTKISKLVEEKWPNAIIKFSNPETVFEKLFHQDEAQLVLHLTDRSPNGIPNLEKTRAIGERLNEILPNNEWILPPHDSHIELQIIGEMMTLYNVDYNVLINSLKRALNAWQIGVLHTGVQYVPMVLGSSPVPLNQLMNELKIINRYGGQIPVKTLVDMKERNDYKELIADTYGAFVPIESSNIKSMRQFRNQQQNIANTIKSEFDVDILFSGNWIASRKMIKELAMVLLISLLLLYFILAAQFESLTQPLILLIEIPLDVSGAFFMLWLFGNSINIMSMIGLVVMSGIVVNDSILKVDTTNRLIKSGVPLLKAIEIAGNRRLKPIIMTSVTTILALLPVLWSGGMGNELQRPLALAVIGSLTLGTILSLYLIPLLYYYLYRNKKQ